jgi:hypothetical protein
MYGTQAGLLVLNFVDVMAIGILTFKIGEELFENAMPKLQPKSKH